MAHIAIHVQNTLSTTSYVELEESEMMELMEKEDDSVKTQNMTLLSSVTLILMKITIRAKK